MATIMKMFCQGYNGLLFLTDAPLMLFAASRNIAVSFSVVNLFTGARNRVRHLCKVGFLSLGEVRSWDDLSKF